MENVLIPPNFDLVWKNGISSGSVAAKSFNHHGTAVRSQNLKGEVNPFPRGSAEWISARYAALRAAPGSKISV